MFLSGTCKWSMISYNSVVDIRLFVFVGVMYQWSHLITCYPNQIQIVHQNVPCTSVLPKRDLKRAISLATICMADIR